MDHPANGRPKLWGSLVSSRSNSQINANMLKPVILGEGNI